MLGAVLAGSYVALQVSRVPFAWAGFFSAAALLIAMALARRSGWKALWFNAAVVAVALGGFEAYLAASQAPPRQDRVEDSQGNRQAMTEPHDVLGYAPIPGRSGTWQRTIGDELVFRIAYTIEDYGFRRMPVATSESLPCIFFFGGSYTFGSGVNDDETMPYLVGQQYLSQHRVFNFAFRGYGPHQMLAGLEHGMFPEKAGCDPVFVIYQMIPNHVDRAAGLASWDTAGPRFVLDDRGHAIRAGTFGPATDRPPGRLIRLLNRYRTYQLATGFLRPKPDESSAELTAAIISRARDLVLERNADAEFHVLYWPAPRSLVPAVVDRLDAAGVETHPITKIMPDLAQSGERYRLHRYEGHPNAAAYQRLADYVARHIIDRRDTDQGPPR